MDTRWKRKQVMIAGKSNSLQLQAMAKDFGNGKQLEIPDTGAVFTWGRSRFCDDQPSHFFIRNDPIVDISCGDEHTVLVCQKGRVFVFGNNGSGQLGLGHTRVITKPTCIKALKSWCVALSACGRAHSLFATKDCRVFACGANADGQLGVGDHMDRLTPTQINFEIPEDVPIVALSAGSMHSALLTGSGEVWTWGNNSDGQCGVNQTDAFILIPTKVALDGVVAMACGYYHTLFASRDVVWAAGEGDSGKLGLDNKHENQFAPQSVESLANCGNVSKFLAVAAGGSHSLVLTELGDVFGFGNNFSGQLGVANTVGSATRRIPIQKRITTIACGESHSAFLSEDGELLTCGDARYGKLGHEGQSLENALLPLSANLRASRVKCGGCHTVALATQASSSSCSYNNSGNSSEILPPIKLKRHSISTVLSSPHHDENDYDDDVKSIATVIHSERKTENDDADDNDDDDEVVVEEEDTLSQTESAHGDSHKRREEKINEPACRTEVPAAPSVTAVRKLWNRLRVARPSGGR